MAELARRLFGWCQTGHHKLCRASYRSAFGVEHSCGCSCHDEAEEAS